MLIAYQSFAAESFCSVSSKCRTQLSKCLFLTLQVRGPAGEVEYHGGGKLSYKDQSYQVSKINMIGGGTGITPLYQVAKVRSALIQQWFDVIFRYMNSRETQNRSAQCCQVAATSFDAQSGLTSASGASLAPDVEVQWRLHLECAVSAYLQPHSLSLSSCLCTTAAWYKAIMPSVKLS